MSQYMNYATTSGNYDSTRIPMGVEYILSEFAAGPVPVADQTILEAGCGTGNYLHAIAPHVSGITGIDFSEAMLAQAGVKLGVNANLVCGSILELPFREGEFDGITCNQVLHHLEGADGAPDFKNTRAFFSEALRVLKPGGRLVLNATLDRQFQDGFWWAELIPVAIASVSSRMPAGSTMQEFLEEAGFTVKTVVPDLSGLLQGSAYLNPTGPLEEAWRAGDSTWSLANDSELQGALDRVQRMLADGTMESWLEEREEKRKQIGQTTFITAEK